jgi:hypothetical protein
MIIIGSNNNTDLALAYFLLNSIFNALLIIKSSFSSWFFNYKNHNFWEN